MLVARHCNHPKTWPSSASRHPLHTVQWRRNKRHETEPTHQFLHLYCRGEKPWFHLVDFQTNFGIIVEINHLKIARNQRTAKRTVEVRKGENLVFKRLFFFFLSIQVYLQLVIQTELVFFVQPFRGKPCEPIIEVHVTGRKRTRARRSDRRPNLIIAQTAFQLKIDWQCQAHIGNTSLKKKIQPENTVL